MAVKVNDTFEEPTTNTALASHTPDTDVEGGGWLTDGTVTVLEATDNVSINAANRGGWIDSGITDQSNSIGFNAGGADNRASLQIRCGVTRSVNAQPDNGYVLNWRPGTNTLHVLENTSGSGTQIGSDISFTINSSSDYNFRLDITGTGLNNIEVFADTGLSRATTSLDTRSDSTHSTGDYSGFNHNLFSSNAARFDNFNSQDVAAPPVGTILPFMMHY